MCGIAGIAGSTAGKDDRLESMLDSMVHRGPDDAHSVKWTHLALGARRLAIMDLSRDGRQPLSGCDSSVTVALNGEIYNHVDLRETLQGLGHRFRGGSDTEVLAHAWEQWGERCVERLHGMFAIAAFEKPTGQLTLARDRTGEKPLYYARSDNELGFASEVRTLRRAGFGDGLELTSVRAFTEFGSVRGEATLFVGISALRPGTLLRYSVHGHEYEAKSYWCAGQTPSDDALPSPRAIRDQVTASILEAARADVPAALCLSAGLDSAILASVLSRAEAISEAFTLRFPIKGYDESIGAKKTAKLNGLSLTEICVDEADWPEILHDFVLALDQPSVDGLNSFIISRSIGKRYKVAFTGVGADEIFGGYSTFRYLTLPRLLRIPSEQFRRRAFTLIDRLPASRPTRVAQIMSGATGSLEASYDHLRSLDPVLQRSLMQDADSASPWSFVEGGELPIARQISEMELSRYLVDTLLRDLDALSMRNSLEMRAPFLHPVLVDLALRIIHRVDFKGNGKSLLREAFAGELPDHLQKPTRKQGFAVPIGAWLTTTVGREFVHAELTVEVWSKQGIFRPSARADILESLKTDLSRPTDHSRYLAVFGALVMTMWCRENNVNATT